jgi:hypothetical protein
MNILDENFPTDQREILARWRIPVRQVGRELAAAGTSDENLLTLLHSLRRVTFFTHDEDFFRADWSHSKYCLVWLDADPDRLAQLVRAFLRHRHFKTWKSRAGLIVRAHPNGLEIFSIHQRHLRHVDWDS